MAHQYTKLDMRLKKYTQADETAESTKKQVANPTYIPPNNQVISHSNLEEKSGIRIYNPFTNGSDNSQNPTLELPDLCIVIRLS